MMNVAASLNVDRVIPIQGPATGGTASVLYAPTISHAGSAQGRLRFWRTITFFALIGGFAVLALRQHQFTDRYSVNVMFSDQWDVYTSLQHPTVWGLFDRQHGLHRQGVGFFITWALAEYSHWNTRWEAFGVSFLLIAAAGLGLALAWRCGVREPLALLAVPLLYLTRRQYETVVCASNISCSAMPIFLLTLYCLTWFIKTDALRLTLIGLLTFFLIFTGYGFFVGVITPAILILEFLQVWAIGETRRMWMVFGALIATGLAWWMFSWNYLWVPAVDFRFPFERPVEYFCFIGLMLSNFYGVLAKTTRVEVIFGLSVALCLTGLCLSHGWRIFRNGVAHEPTSVAIFSLASFAMIYCVLTSIGRVSLGWQYQATASRYVTLMIPGGLALFLHLASYKPKNLGAILGILYALSISFGALTLSRGEWEIVRNFHNARLVWKDTYLESHDQTKANRKAGIELYPGKNAIAGRLRYLERNNLNFFYHAE